MNNLLIVGANQASRFNHALHIVLENLCLNTLKPCYECTNCLRVKNNSHPNILIIEPQISEAGLESEIKIEQVRLLIQEHHKKSFESGLSFFIISHLHKITKSAANALLKTLEETSREKVFITLAPSKMSVLPTLSSRLVTIAIKPHINKISLEEKDLKLITEISSTKMQQRLFLAAQFSQNKSELINYLELLQQSTHQLLYNFCENKNPQLPPKIVHKISEAIASAITMLEKNLNTKLIIENLLLKHWPYF